jgi:diguanylate cyclase (GGDEF)-like protein
MRDITNSRAQVSALERQSFEDALTRLPNRHWLNSYLPALLEHLKSNQQMAAVLFIDLDGFKAVNDTLGHEIGDEVLRHAGLRLRDAVRPHDSVARIGGDEFLVVLERIGTTREATHVAQRIVDAFRQPFGSPKGEASVGASIGIATYPRDGTTADALLRAADSAMYAVKGQGKGVFMFYDKRLAEAALARQVLEKELRQALDSDQLIVYYQPRISPVSGRVESMEALVRWQHPRKGLLEPLEFIGLAEEAGLIVGLGEVVTKKVCQQLAAWQKSFKHAVPVSINVSPLQLRDAFASALRQALQDNAVPAELVEIEITESAMTDLTDPRIAASVAAIRELGCKLVVDDFGTGYSSLSRLQDLDCDVLKVDRAFTARLARTEKGAALFEAIIGMAHALDMIVVAEGVETAEQLLELQRLGCDEVQGYLFSRPLPAANSAEFFSSSYAV